MGTDGAAFTNCDEWLDAVYELELGNVPGPYSSVMHPCTARDLPDETQAAAEELVLRFATGKPVAYVLKDLAAPLYLTPADILRHVELKEPPCH